MATEMTRGSEIVTYEERCLFSLKTYKDDSVKLLSIVKWKIEARAKNCILESSFWTCSSNEKRCKVQECSAGKDCAGKL